MCIYVSYSSSFTIQMFHNFANERNVSTLFNTDWMSDDKT